MKEEGTAVSEKPEVMKTLSAQSKSRGDRGDEDQAAIEISRMIAELNEVRMRLDSVVRKIGDTGGADILSDAHGESVGTLRLRLVHQLDRIREKLVARSRAL